MIPPLTFLFIFGDLIALLFVAGFLAWLVCRIVIVQGKSMFPTFEEGDRLLVFDWWPKRYLQRGQIVLLKPFYVVTPALQKSPLSQEQLLVKRIIALADETITTSLEDIQKEIRFQFAQYHDKQGIRTWHIPPQHLFIQGDNRFGSIDSLLCGPLPLQSICGVVVMKLPWTFCLFPRRKEGASDR